MMQKEKQKKKSSKASAFTLIVAFICVALMGIVLVPLLPVKLNPSHTLPSLSVQYAMSRASSRVVEREVTSKLEAMFSRIRGIKNIYSNSGNGGGNITLELDKHVDVDVARFEVSTIIRQLWPTLPEEVSYPYIRLKKSEEKATRPFMSYTINAPANPILIQKYTEEHIKTKLAQLAGLYKIEVRGATPMEWVLEYDTHQLQHLGLRPSDLSQAIHKHYSTVFLGKCSISSSSRTKQWMRLVLEATGTKHGFDPKEIRVKNASGQLIPLNELIKVKHQSEAPSSYYRINGLNSIYLFLTAEDAANQLELNNAVVAKMEQLKKELPPGYEIHVSYDATEFIRGELSKIYLRTAITIAILLFFVFIITLNARYLLLIVVSLAVNIAVAVIFYYLFHLEMQLYSLAGITVSLNLIIDNTIVMTDHYLRCKDRKAFIAILAATLTTIGALAVIFFLEDQIRLNLQDFAAVVIVNLAVSLLVALFFVPSLIEKIGLQKKIRKQARFRRMKISFTRIYAWFIAFTCRWKKTVFLFFLLAFGLPVFLLPDKLEGEGALTKLYNETLGTTAYKETVKPVLDKVLGGTLRLFVRDVYNGSYFTRNEEVVLSVAATLPNGSTLEQMNALVKRIEHYIGQFKEVSQFQTVISDAYRANIRIFFKDDFQKVFPYILKRKIIDKALELGGGGWSVYGLKDQGFSNDVHETAGAFKVKLYGYNYDELYAWAEQFKAQLLKHRRIREVEINANFSRWKDEYKEYYLKLNKERMALKAITPSHLFSTLSTTFGRDVKAGRVLTEDGAERIKLTSKQSKTYDVWALNHYPMNWGEQSYKLSDFAAVEKGQAPQLIAKENQQYKLCLQYEYIGPSHQGRKILKKDLKSFTQKLPLGYSAEAVGYRYSWGEKEYKQYLLLGLVIVIIFFITSILFNSLRQPLAVIFVIPISYIGVFLTFYLFRLNFDQGGFASFILLCGITVNASIYIMNEYNAIRRRLPQLSPQRAYTKAWNTKIIPILLTIISTILGFVPFLIGTTKESFWFPLAAGTIGGLIMSLVGIFLFLPMMTLRKKDSKITKI